MFINLSWFPYSKKDHNAVYHKDRLYVPHTLDIEIQQAVCYLVILPLNICFLIYIVGIKQLLVWFGELSEKHIDLVPGMTLMLISISFIVIPKSFINLFFLISFALHGPTSFYTTIWSYDPITKGCFWKFTRQLEERQFIHFQVPFWIIIMSQKTTAHGPNSAGSLFL